MSQKAERIARIVGTEAADGLNPYYSGFIKRFNKGEFYESHDVLEQLWLADRHGPNGAFYKGLIQLAGAFVHLQKGRLRPSSALFALAAANFAKYPSNHERLSIRALLALIESWDTRLRNADFQVNPLSAGPPPHLDLL